ncbi:MAG: serine--tRNA ligase, partial [Acidobacteria bacterium]|nr:serine--tRNA ligase [Acidobacteriota bacterium]
MIDIAILRDDPAALEAGLARRSVTVDVAALRILDGERRTVRADAEELRARQKEGGKAIAGLEGAEKEAAIAVAAELSDRYKEMLSRADELDNEFMATWVTIPNLADDTAAEGLTEEDYVEISRWGNPPEFGFEPQDHVDLGTELGVIDIERATKISGSGFGIIKGRLALLEFALVRWAFDVLSGYGFEPVLPPVLVREEALFGTGFFPADRDQVYSVGEDDLYLAGTSEVPLAAMHGDEFLDPEEFPIRYAGFSTCFRVEAGTYGKDTRGLVRLHQFNKVELVTVTTPESSYDELERLTGNAEEVLKKLELPYRVVSLCTGDLGFAATKTYDLEVWLPAQNTYREISSCSNCGDFQARRAKIRYRPEGKKAKPRLTHTLNGSALAVGRTVVALLENGQQADGSV